MANGRTGPATVLTDRQTERALLTDLVRAIREGESRTLVMRGDAGFGKTTLLDFLTEQATGCQVLRVTGVLSEMELPFAGVHQLCAPYLDRLDHLPVPQQEALRTAFGMSAGPAPDRFLVALAVLGLLSEAAGAGPLLCVIDDQQWLDKASAQVLGFVARRLAAEPIALAFATRTAGDELVGLPEMYVGGLAAHYARELLDSALTGPLDERVRQQIVAEADGNPLALLEVPRGLTPAQLAGGFGLPVATSLSERIEESFRRQLKPLPPETLRLLQLIAADPSGNPALVHLAAERLGIEPGAVTAAAEADIIDFGLRTRFRHPVLRTVVYLSATPADRRAAHLALAEVTDPVVDPDRRAWHRAHAAHGPDEDVAAELEASAVRAQARGGLAAAAAFLERAAELTADPVRRADRLLAAAGAQTQAGSFDAALALLAAAEAGSLDAVQSARLGLLRGQVKFASATPAEAVPLLVDAARRFESLHRDTARDTYLTAWVAASYAGGMAPENAGLAEVSRQARELPPPTGPAGVGERLLDALCLMATDGITVAAPRLRAVADEFVRREMSEQEQLHLGWFAQMPCGPLWDFEAFHEILEHQVRNAREAGALDRLRFMLGGLVHSTAWAGDLATAAELTAELAAITAATGSAASALAETILACSRGDEAAAPALIEAAIREGAAAGQGMSIALVNAVSARLYNGLGRYGEALAAAVKAAGDSPGLYISVWVLPELAEAAIRTGDPAQAQDALTLTAPSALAGGTDLGLGLLARMRALTSADAEAEHHYRESVDRLTRTRFRAELGRSHLLYGEWLKARDRRTEAQSELRTAHTILTEIGYAAFAERARQALRATGERVRTQPATTATPLTEQEEIIARLAADGRTNGEIGAQLFISARTVEWHLRKIYTKLGIARRTDLAAGPRWGGPETL